MDKGRAKRFGGRKMIDQAITELVQYGLDTGLVAPEDKIFVTSFSNYGSRNGKPLWRT